MALTAEQKAFADWQLQQIDPLTGNPPLPGANPLPINPATGGLITGANQPLFKMPTGVQFPG